ncbi:MAG TPA: hypothetical protein VIV60_26985, partial [Polyangiaceae bacterium]
GICGCGVVDLQPVVTVPPNVNTSACREVETITVGQATAFNACGLPQTETGRVVMTNGIALSTPIPVVSGQVQVGVGTHTIEWRAPPGSGVPLAYQTLTVGSIVQASLSFLLDDNAQLRDSRGGLSVMLNSGTGLTQVGNDSRAGGILSVGNVNVLHRAIIQGNITSAVGYSVASDATVSGGVQVAPVTLPSLPTLPAFPSPSGPNIVLNTGETRTLSAGSYPSVTVTSGATLTLLAGDYFFQAFTLNSGGVVRVTPTTRVFVRTTLVFQGPFRTPSGSVQSIFLGFAGATLSMEATFNGTLVAPSAAVTFGVGSGLTFTGAFYARTLEVRPGSALVCLRN